MPISSVLLLILCLLLCQLSDSLEFSSDEQNTRFRSAAKRDPGASNCNVNSDCSYGSLCCEISLSTDSFKSGTCYDPKESICCSLDGSIMRQDQLTNFTGECCNYDASANLVANCPLGYKCGPLCSFTCDQNLDCYGGDSCCRAPDQLSQQGAGTCYSSSSQVCCFDGRTCNSTVCNIPEGGQCCAVGSNPGDYTYCEAGTRCGFYQDTVHCIATSADGNGTITQPISITNSTTPTLPGLTSKKHTMVLTLAITIPVVVVALIAIVITAWAIRRKHFGGGKIVSPNMNAPPGNTNAPPAYSGPSAAPLMSDGLKFAGPSGAVIPPGYFSAVGMMQGVYAPF